MTLDERIETVMEDYLRRANNITYNDAFAVFASVIRTAARYWENIQAEDFCIQMIGDDVIVFGATNRLVWSPDYGFRPSFSHCTEKFLHDYEALGPLPGQKKKSAPVSTVSRVPQPQEEK